MYIQTTAGEQKIRVKSVHETITVILPIITAAVIQKGGSTHTNGKMKI